jgi:signal transduction histidine kinase
MMATVVVLSVSALSRTMEVTYMVFPALIWAALRFGPQGATLAVATTAGLTVFITAHEAGAFMEQPITNSALSTQLYIAVAAITTLCLAAIVAERRQGVEALAEAKRREGQRAADERQRIARDLHDSVSQSLFSTALHVRSAERALADEGVDPAGRLAKELGSVRAS